MRGVVDTVARHVALDLGDRDPQRAVGVGIERLAAPRLLSLDPAAAEVEHAAGALTPALHPLVAFLGESACDHDQRVVTLHHRVGTGVEQRLARLGVAHLGRAEHHRRRVFARGVEQLEARDALRLRHRRVLVEQHRDQRLLHQVPIARQLRCAQRGADLRRRRGAASGGAAGF